MKLQSKHWCFISTKAGSNWLLGHDFNNCVHAELKNHSDTSLAVPRADSLDSCLWLGPDPRISTEGEAQVLHQIWRSDAVPSSSAGCISSAVTCEGQGGHRLWMWQHLSGANRGVEGRAGVYCCALCHALGRLCVSPWLRAMQKLAKNIVRRCSSSSNTSICTFERDISLPKAHFYSLKGFFCVSFLRWLLIPNPNPHQRNHCTWSEEQAQQFTPSYGTRQTSHHRSPSNHSHFGYAGWHSYPDAGWWGLHSSCCSPCSLPLDEHADLLSSLDGPHALPCLPAWLCLAAAPQPGTETSFLSKFQTCTKVLTATFQHDKKLWNLGLSCILVPGIHLAQQFLLEQNKQTRNSSNF